MAYSEDYPNIIMEISGVAGGWSGVTAYHDFEVRDAGIKKVSEATINLHNVNGRFTNPVNPFYLGLNRELRIRVDVGIWSGVIFQGNIYGFDPDEYIQGPQNPVRSRLTVIARGKYGQRCLREKISHPYFDYGWNASGAIVNFLLAPDSMVNTGIALDLDVGGAMENNIFPTNPDKSTLLQAIQDACEEYGYDGYFDDVAGVLHLRCYRAPNRTLSGANPAIHYVLSSGLTVCRPRADIDDIKNYVFIWGDIDAGFPAQDNWCERGVRKYAPAAWTTGHANLAIYDDFATYSIDTNSVRANTTGAVPLGSCYIQLNIPNTGYFKPQTPANPNMDFNNTGNAFSDRFDCLGFLYRSSLMVPMWDVCVKLIDSGGERVRLTFVDPLFPPLLPNIWYNFTDTDLYTSGTHHFPCQFPIDDGNHGGWVLETVGPFDWGNVQNVRIGPWDAFNVTWAAVAINEDFWVDGLRAEGIGWPVDPFTRPNYNPPHIDGASIGTYGRTVYHHVDENILCFENAYNEGERILEENKDPYERLTIRKGARVWAQPSETVQSTILPWGISGASYRISERIIRYSAEEKLLRTTHELVDEGAEISSSTIRGEKMWGSLETE